MQLVPAAHTQLFARLLPAQAIPLECYNNFNFFSPGRASSRPFWYSHTWRTGISHIKNFLNPEKVHLYVTLYPSFQLRDVQQVTNSHMSGNNCVLKIHKDVFKFAMNDIVNLIFIKLDE